MELSKLSYLLLTAFIDKIKQNIKRKTLFIITADHGQIDVNPKETIYLNKDKFILKNLKKDKKGKIIYPTGSARDVFLHVRKNKINDLYEYLKKKLERKAGILKTQEAISLGLFGKKEINSKFKKRLGDILILPYRNYTIWREYKDKKFAHFGHHGGLSKEEMVIPFSICALDELRGIG